MNPGQGVRGRREQDGLPRGCDALAPRLSALPCLGEVGPARQAPWEEQRRSPTTRRRLTRQSVTVFASLETPAPSVRSAGAAWRCSHPRAGLVLCVRVQMCSTLLLREHTTRAAACAQSSRASRNHTSATGMFSVPFIQASAGLTTTVPFDVGGAISEVKMPGPQLGWAGQGCTHSVQPEAEAGK